MIKDFICQWNPFNIYGVRVEIEDLISNPLQSYETLMQDRSGNFRRIEVPKLQCSLWKRLIFWFQTHLNQKGYLEAIDRLIALFYQKLLQDPPQKTENLQDLNLQISQLRLLKNDYGFVHLKTGDASFIDVRLKEIERHAYSIFSYYYKQQVIEQEEIRKKIFITFQEELEQKLHYLATAYSIGLAKARLLAVMTSETLPILFDEHVESLESRLQLIQDLYQRTNEIEKIHQGKFTGYLINEQLQYIRIKISNEVSKIRVEIESIIRNLILHYRLNPLKKEAKKLLDLMQIDPEVARISQSCACLFHETLEEEIKKIQNYFHNKKEKK